MSLLDALTSINLPGLPQTDYYAPNFKLEVDGFELDPYSKGDVLDVKVTMDIDNMCDFQLSINNWDDRKLDFKYTDTTTFDLGHKVHIQLGYAGELRSMIRGQITGLSPRFSESGPPTLSVTGQDGMMLLRDRKPVEGEKKKYENMEDWQIAQEVANRNHLQFDATKDGQQKYAVVWQKNQDDAQFLMERAKRIDFECFIMTDPDTDQSTLHFIRPTDARDSRPVRVYTFEWRKSLINFTPQITLSRQVSKLTVRGWNPRTKEPISYTATRNDLPGSSGGGKGGPDLVSSVLNGKQEVVVDAPVMDEQEARELAIARLREKAYEFITGTAQVIGLPDLRPGYNVELLGLGKRFSGTYYVKKVEHVMGSNGYLTQFEVRRVFEGSQK